MARRISYGIRRKAGVGDVWSMVEWVQKASIRQKIAFVSKESGRENNECEDIVCDAV